MPRIARSGVSRSFRVQEGDNRTAEGAERSEGAGRRERPQRERMREPRGASRPPPRSGGPAGVPPAADRLAATTTGARTIRMPRVSARRALSWRGRRVCRAGRSPCVRHRASRHQAQQRVPPANPRRGPCESDRLRPREAHSAGRDSRGLAGRVGRGHAHRHARIHAAGARLGEGVRRTRRRVLPRRDAVRDADRDLPFRTHEGGYVIHAMWGSND